MCMVNGKRLRLAYQVVTASATPAATLVQLWYTRDGKVWQHDSGPPQSHTPYVMDLKEEGLYGLTLVACNAKGESMAPPVAGEQPQFWVAVDWTRPNVSLIGAEIDQTKRTVTVRWSAGDEHLSQRPITLSYAERPTGPWMPLAANLKNSGTYTGPLPPSMPRRIFFKVEAADQVGNVAEARSMTPLLFDPSPSTSERVPILRVDWTEE
jgi:hypothetical protein